MEFENESRIIHVRPVSETPKSISILLKYSGGIIKTEKQAKVVLLSVSVIIFYIGIRIWITNLAPESDINQSPVYQEDLSPELVRTLPKDVLASIPYRNEK